MGRDKRVGVCCAAMLAAWGAVPSWAQEVDIGPVTEADEYDCWGCGGHDQEPFFPAERPAERGGTAWDDAGIAPYPGAPQSPSHQPGYPAQPGGYAQPGYPQPGYPAQGGSPWAGQWQCSMTTTTRGRGGNSHTMVQSALYVQPNGQFQVQGNYVMNGETMPFVGQGQAQPDGVGVSFMGQAQVQTMMGPQAMPFMAGGNPSPDGRTLSYRETGAIPNGAGQFSMQTSCQRG